MTDEHVMRIVREIVQDIHMTEDRSGTIDTHRRMSIGMTADVARALEELEEIRTTTFHRNTYIGPTFCGYPVRIISAESSKPGIWIMREIEVPLGLDEEGTDEHRADD